MGRPSTRPASRLRVTKRASSWGVRSPASAMGVAAECLLQLSAHAVQKRLHARAALVLLAGHGHELQAVALREARIGGKALARAAIEGVHVLAEVCAVARRAVQAEHVAPDICDDGHKERALVRKVVVQRARGHARGRGHAARADAREALPPHDGAALRKDGLP